jgi:hypothetical protein
LDAPAWVLLPSQRPNTNYDFIVVDWAFELNDAPYNSGEVLD